MVILKVLSSVSFLISPILLGATLQEACEQKVIEINETISIYERINTRHLKDKHEYETDLAKGYRNKTLESEQLRDEAYLLFSRDTINEIRVLRGILCQKKNIKTEIEKTLTSVKELINLHRLIMENTLMNF